jgi:hypothetical protein
MRRHRIAAATAGITALLITMLILASPGASSSHQSTGAGPIELGGDVTPEVRRLASVVVRAAHEHGEKIAPTELEIRFVDRVEAEGFPGGWADGRLILVGRNMALPERTLLHEIAHAAVGVDVGHGEPWRSVYITAFRNEFGERKAERELRRLCWVNDKSYLDPVPQPCQIPDDSSRRR